MQQINFLNCDLAKLKAEINLNSAWNDPNIAPSIQNRIYKMGKFLGRHGDEKLYYGELDGIVYGFMETKDPNTYKWEKEPETYVPTTEEPAGDITIPPTLEDVNNDLVVYIMDGDTKVYYFATYDKIVSQYIGGLGIDINAIMNSTNCFSTEEIILTNLIAEEDLGEFATDELANAELTNFKNGLPTEDVMNGAVAKASYTVQGTYKVKYYKFNSTWGDGEGSDFKAYVPEIGEIFQDTVNIEPSVPETYFWQEYSGEAPEDFDVTDYIGTFTSSEDLIQAQATYMAEHLPTAAGLYLKMEYTLNGEEDYDIGLSEIDNPGEEGTKFYQYGTYSLSAIFKEKPDKWIPSSYVRTAPTSLVRCAVLPDGYTGEKIKSYPENAEPNQTFDQWLFEINRTHDWGNKTSGYYERVISNNPEKKEYYVITTNGPIRPTDTITVEFILSKELYSKYAEDAIVNIDGREYTIDILDNPMNFYMNRDHRISIKWAGDIIETFTFIAIR